MFLGLLGAGDKTQGKDFQECTSGLLVISRSLAQLGLLDSKKGRSSSMEDHRKVRASPTRAILAGKAISVVVKSPADMSSRPKGGGSQTDKSREKGGDGAERVLGMSFVII